jgi:hypothetical protein
MIASALTSPYPPAQRIPAKKLFGLGKNLENRPILVDWNPGLPVLERLADTLC